MSRGDLDQPHPVWAALQVAVGSALLVQPWWTELPEELWEVALLVLTLLAGLAALGYAALNCLAMRGAPAGRQSVRVLLVALVLSVVWVIAPLADADRHWWVSVLPAVYAVFVARVAWREHDRGPAGDLGAR